MTGVLTRDTETQGEAGLRQRQGTRAGGRRGLEEAGSTVPANPRRARPCRLLVCGLLAARAGTASTSVMAESPYWWQFVTEAPGNQFTKLYI